ncbi:calcium and integrin-binding protein 1-like [Culex pipiens pallens]|uniref:calcium and integrin-binding protein 1-like n=1 Tax=Culex pipiens pallens TaxID=42434 RepID=UPI0019549F73|nr:calcium and integrin-binding protein 1-like [Culex pipiens pallens]
MGAKESSLLSAEQLEDYAELTYLTKWEILLIMDKFLPLEPDEIRKDLHRRIPNRKIMEAFPQLKFNPFRDRIFEVFSSGGDTRCSFEDVLDLFSVMSDRCPHRVKAAWAFRVFDVDNDRQISADDIVALCDRLVGTDPGLHRDEKTCIAEVILEEMDLQKNGSLGEFDFIHAIAKVPEFYHSFSFRP